MGTDRTPQGVGRETRLADGFWMDSVELLEVIVACEHAFGITFDEASEIEWSGLETLGDLAELIRARQSGARAGP